MSEFVFLWTTRSEEHIGVHGVSPQEAEQVAERAKPPYPEDVGDGKRSAWSGTDQGRLLQVIFVHVPLDDVQPEEYARLAFHERLALEDGDPAVRIIHARDLTDDEKKRFRRRSRGRS
jgi:uncharacterized DUF497 family protein